MNRIREIRKSKNLKQIKLAEMTGIKQGRLSYYEHGKRGIDLETAAVIAEALGCKVDDLIKK